MRRTPSGRPTRAGRWGAPARWGIGAAFEYVPNHLQPAFAAFRRPMPATERLFGEVLSLPLHAELMAGEVAQVVEAGHAFFAPPRSRALAPDPRREAAPR